MSVPPDDKWVLLVLHQGWGQLCNGNCNGALGSISSLWACPSQFPSGIYTDVDSCIARQPLWI